MPGRAGQSVLFSEKGSMAGPRQGMKVGVFYQKVRREDDFFCLSLPSARPLLVPSSPVSSLIDFLKPRMALPRELPTSETLLGPKTTRAITRMIIRCVG